jgi:hypothetical protein
MRQLGNALEAFQCQYCIMTSSAAPPLWRVEHIWLFAVQTSKHRSEILELPFLNLNIRDAQVFALLQ